jgi:hypothetical protein
MTDSCQQCSMPFDLLEKITALIDSQTETLALWGAGDEVPSIDPDDLKVSIRELFTEGDIYQS